MTYSFFEPLLGGNFAVFGAIVVAIVIYGAGLLITKAVKDDEWQAMPVIGKRLKNVLIRTDRRAAMAHRNGEAEKEIV